jgi:hypothetical protein
MTRTPITRDVSLLLPRARGLEPFEWERKGRTLVRVPCFWEDDVEMGRARPSWDLSELMEGRGLKVFDFHPVHVFLNSADSTPYSGLKKDVPDLAAATEEQMTMHVHRGPGTRGLFVELLEDLGRDGRSLRIRDIRASGGGVS